MNLATSNILCIDNDIFTSEWIKTTLDSAGLPSTVRNARSASEGFQLLGEEKFDLCILEYALKDMTGPQLCTMVRRMGWSVPDDAFTVMDREIDRKMAVSAG